jgi:hypothetical protein
MAFATSPGHPAYTGNFIPEIWSGKLIENFYDATVLAAIANTDYEGEIKAHGDTVNIRTTPELTIRDYVKGQTLSIENPDKPKLQLLIDKGKYFAAVEDDVDQVQSDIAMMDSWSKDASERMKIVIDTDVLGNIATDVPAANKGLTAGEQTLAIDLGVTGTANALTTANVLAEIINHGTVLDEANVPEQDRWMVIPAKMAGLIKQSDLKDSSITGDGSSPLRNGRLGMIDRFMLYVSHNLPLSATGPAGEFTIFAGHKKGLTFASQMTNMETLRSETTFGDIIRGLQVYGYKVVKPEALTAGIITIA